MFDHKQVIGDGPVYCRRREGLGFQVSTGHFNEMNVQLKTHHECHLTQIRRTKKGLNIIMSLVFGSPSCSWHFNLISNGLSKVLPLLTDIGGPKGWHYIFMYRFYFYLRNPKFVCISFPGDESIMPHCTPPPPPNLESTLSN